MTIKEVEEQTGLARSNVRFYEKEKLIVPSRNEENGYRDYSEKDVGDIKKIAYLRTLGISIEDIRNVMSKKVTLQEVIEKQRKVLEDQMADLKKAKAMCEKMLVEERVSYEELQVEKYVTGLQGYWKDNRSVFKLDSVSFLWVWGSLITWFVIMALSLLIGVLSYAKLPTEIPVQWSKGAASSFVDRKFIFAYPMACIAIRYLFRPIIYLKLKMNYYYNEVVAEYLTNYLCFIALSVEVFSILFIYGVVENVVAVLLADTFVLVGVLVAGIMKMNLKAKQN